MNQATYREYFKRLPKEEPLKICRICIQETHNLIACSDPEWSDIRRSYEHITKLKVMGVAEYFMCTECINMLRQICQFQDMLRLSDKFWMKYVKKEPSENKEMIYEPIIKIGEMETLHQEADFFFEQCCNEIKLESNGIDIEMKSIVQSNDVIEMDSITTVVAVKIEKCCDICDEEFSSTWAFEKHIAVHAKRYNCAHCGMSFKSKASIIVHLQQVHNEGVATNPYKSICSKCNLDLSSKENLRTHIQQYHGPEEEATCPECNKIFINLKKLKRHMTTHREKLYQCTECAKSFRHQSFLDKHTEIHSSIRAFCDLCGLGLSSNNHLKRHIAGVHENKKVKKYRRSIECTLCEVIFPRLTEARVHFFAKHTKAAWKEFRSLCCGCCCIRFDSTVIRDAHYSLYEGDHDKSKSRLKKRGRPKFVSWSQKQRPHECDICKYTYKTPDSLENHMKRHHKNPRPFKCEFCGSTHARVIELRSHIKRAHTEDRPFSCSECNYKCVTRTEINNHNNKWHHSDK